MEELIKEVIEDNNKEFIENVNTEAVIKEGDPGVYNFKSDLHIDVIETKTTEKDLT